VTDTTPAAVGTFVLDDGIVVDSLLDLQAQAVARWDAGVRAYVQDGAGSNRAVRANRMAHERWALRSRVLRDVSSIDTTTTVLGQRVELPVLIAPSGLHTLVHPDGEVATAVGARDAGTVMILSAATGRTIPDVAASGVDLWFQLYWGEDRGRVRELVQMADAAGVGALCLTVDMPARPLVGATMRSAITSVAHHLPAYLPPRTAHLTPGAWDHDTRLTWADLAWLRDVTSLPIVVKGVMSAEDVAPARDSGVDAIVVSNHGGRALDTPLGTLDVLPEIADELTNGGPELYVDGGFRHGGEVLAALALGARAVLIGRPALWALTLGGARTVTDMLRLLQYQLEVSMARVGVTSVAEIDSRIVRRAPAGSSPDEAPHDDSGSGAMSMCTPSSAPT
jgi:4-hydroxymandelate oxidase